MSCLFLPRLLLCVVLDASVVAQEARNSRGRDIISSVQSSVGTLARLEMKERQLHLSPRMYTL